MKQAPLVLLRTICSSLALFGLLSASVGCSGLGPIAAGDREKAVMLNQTLATFQKASYWGAVDEASVMVAKEALPRFMEQAHKDQRKQKLVSIKTDSVTFGQDMSQADVMVRVKYFKIPSYVVQTRVEKQLWAFERLSGGWKFFDRAVVTEEADGESDSKIE